MDPELRLFHQNSIYFGCTGGKVIKTCAMHPPLLSQSINAENENEKNTFSVSLFTCAILDYFISTGLIKITQIKNG